MGGRVGDRLGRKRSFLIALIGFAVASAVGSAAVNLPMLVAARAGQGVFGALLAAVASLDTVTAKFAEHGITAQITGLNDPSAALHKKVSDNRAAAH